MSPERPIKSVSYTHLDVYKRQDGYQLIETSNTGMEHQSAVSYGNGYKPGYRGRDGSGTGWGLKWDFIIIHESGHEWFGNNLTTQDLADMWVHEGFTNYSETLFIEYFYGKDAADAYNAGIRKGIRNDKPVTGQYNVNDQGSGDTVSYTHLLLPGIHFKFSLIFISVCLSKILGISII